MSFPNIIHSFQKNALLFELKDKKFQMKTEDDWILQGYAYQDIENLKRYKIKFKIDFIDQEIRTLDIRIISLNEIGVSIEIEDEIHTQIESAPSVVFETNHKVDRFADEMLLISWILFLKDKPLLTDDEMLLYLDKNDARYIENYGFVKILYNEYFSDLRNLFSKSNEVVKRKDEESRLYSKIWSYGFNNIDSLIDCWKKMGD